MGYHSEQMNNPVSVIRGTTSIRTEEGLVKILSGTSLEEARNILVRRQEYGNTKFPDDWLALCYIKSHFIASNTAQLVGYSVRFTNGGFVIAGNNLSKRLWGVNTNNFLSLIRAFIKTGHITKEDVKTILNPTSKAGRIASNSSLYRKLAKEIVVKTIEKQGSRQKAAEALEVDVGIINKWADIEKP